MGGRQGLKKLSFDITIDMTALKYHVINIIYRKTQRAKKVIFQTQFDNKFILYKVCEVQAGSKRYRLNLV